MCEICSTLSIKAPTKSPSMTSFLCLYCWLWTGFNYYFWRLRCQLVCWVNVFKILNLCSQLNLLSSLKPRNKNRISWRLTISCRKPSPYRNQSADLLCKSMNWFLYGNGLRHERVNRKYYEFPSLFPCLRGLFDRCHIYTRLHILVNI